MGDFRPQKHIERAMALHRAGKLSEADALYRKVLDVQPDHPDALHLSGVIAHQTGKHQRAITLITRARAHFPRLPELHHHLGLALHAVGRLDEAEVALKTALGLRPGFAEAHGSYASLLLARGQSDAALVHSTQALRLKPDDAHLHNTHGNVLMQRGQPEAAITSYERALQLAPGLAMAHTNLGNALRALKRYEAAVQCYEIAVSLDPHETNACLYLGATLEKLGKTDEAAAAYREALRRRPGWSDAQYFLSAILHSSVGAGDEAAPAVAPPGYVAQLFDSYAGSFDQHLTGKLQYRAPEQLYAVLAPQLPARPLDILDLGCGTGLLGPLLRPHAARLGGVDLSPRMLGQAQQRGVYDELLCGDLLVALAQRPGAYDLLIATDVLIYLGDLEPLFRAAHAALRPAGLFAFSIESNRADEGVRLQPTRRYSHAPAYVRRLTAAHGFTELSLTDTILRQQGGQDIPGHLVVLQLATANS